jgi:hypothetical protein
MASLSYRELKGKLEEQGCRKLRDARHGGHELWVCPNCPTPISVPKKLKGEGTLLAIMKAAGIDS